MTKLLISPVFVYLCLCLSVLADMNSSRCLSMSSVCWCLGDSLCIPTWVNTQMSLCVYWSCVRETWRLKMDGGGVGLECGLRLMTQFQRKENRKWRKKVTLQWRNLANFSWVIKVNISSQRSCCLCVPLTWCNEKGILFLWSYSPQTQNLYLTMRKILHIPKLKE